MTESTVTGTGSDKDIVQTITRYDVGVKLSLTPHITPDGRVQMELEPSIEAVTAATGGDVLAPTISKRMVKTVQTARTGETIVIAGLTRSDKTTSAAASRSSARSRSSGGSSAGTRRRRAARTSSSS